MKGFESLINPDEHMNDEERGDYSEHFYQNLSLLQHQQRTASCESQLSAEYCDDCGNEIPEKRRQAIKGVRLCVACKQADELKERIYR